MSKSVPECAPPKYNPQTRTYEGRGGPCWTSNRYLLEEDPRRAGGSDDYTIFNLGPIGEIQTNTYVDLIDGKLEFVGVNFAANFFDQMLGILKERYGPPTKVENREWQSQAGAKFNNVVATWLGKRISIIIEARGSKKDTGSVMFMTTSWVAKRAKQREEAIKKGAKDL